MNKIKIIGLFLCFVFIPFSVFAKKWSLSDCINYAVENNIEIKQQALLVDHSKVELDISKSSRLPNLNAETGQSFSFGRSPSQIGISEKLDMSNTAFSIYSSMPIFTGFRINNEIKRDELNLNAAMESLKKAKENLELHITSLYLKCLFNKEIISIYEKILELTKKQVERTEILFRSGTIPESQLYDIKAQLAKDEVNLISADNELTLSLLYLGQALNLHDLEDFDILEPSISDKDIKENMMNLISSPNEIYDIALGIKPHIKEAEYRLDISKSEIEIAKSFYWPTVSLGLSMGSFYNYIYNKSSISDIFFREYKAGAWVQMGESYYWPEFNLGVSVSALSKYLYEIDALNNNNFFKQIKDNRNELIGLNISIPIFNRNKTKNQVKIAKINMTNNALALDNIKLALYKEIQEAYTGALSSKSKYIAAEKALKAAEESYNYAEIRYNTGNMTVFEYNEAQTKLFNSRSEQVQAKYDFLFRSKILDFYKGINISID